MSETKTLGDKLPEECARVRKLINIYREVGPAGNFAIAMMEAALAKANRAMISGDVVAMIAAYKELQDFTE